MHVFHGVWKCIFKWWFRFFEHIHVWEHY
jgi:hypothetical protein